MLLDIEATKETVGILTGALTLLTSGYKAWQYQRKRLQEYRKNEQDKAERFEALKGTVEGMVPLLDEIRHELKANGGGSLRDAINDIRNEQSLERAARRLSSSLPSFEAVVSPEGNISVMHASPAYVHLTGLTRDDVEEQGWLRAVVEEDRERVELASDRAFRESKVFVMSYTVQHVHTKQRVRIEHTGTPVFNMNGKCVGWVGMMRPQGEGRHIMES